MASSAATAVVVGEAVAVTVAVAVAGVADVSLVFKENSCPSVLALVVVAGLDARFFLRERPILVAVLCSLRLWSLVCGSRRSHRHLGLADAMPMAAALHRINQPTDDVTHCINQPAGTYQVVPGCAGLAVALSCYVSTRASASVRMLL